MFDSKTVLAILALASLSSSGNLLGNPPAPTGPVGGPPDTANRWGPQPCDVEGVVACETSVSDAAGGPATYVVGERRYSVSGPISPALAACTGQPLHLRGRLFSQFSPSGESLPRLDLESLALPGEAGTRSQVRLCGAVEPHKDCALIGGRALRPAGPLAPALLALGGVTVEVAGTEDPASPGTLVVASIARCEPSKAMAESGASDGAASPEQLLERASEDALGRYSLLFPGNASGTWDGAGPRVKAASRASDRLEVVVDTFGGKRGAWLGSPIAYVYDFLGQFLDVRKL